jgi:hypothetical protein
MDARDIFDFPADFRDEPVNNMTVTGAGLQMRQIVPFWDGHAPDLSASPQPGLARADKFARIDAIIDKIFAKRPGKMQTAKELVRQIVADETQDTKTAKEAISMLEIEKGKKFDGSALQEHFKHLQKSAGATRRSKEEEAADHGEAAEHHSAIAAKSDGEVAERHTALAKVHEAMSKRASDDAARAGEDEDHHGAMLAACSKGFDLGDLAKRNELEPPPISGVTPNPPAARTGISPVPRYGQKLPDNTSAPKVDFQFQKLFRVEDPEPFS